MSVSDNAPKRPTTGRKAWRTPQLRRTVPARRTRGGNTAQNDQDGVFYDLS